MRSTAERLRAARENLEKAISEFHAVSAEHAGAEGAQLLTEWVVIMAGTSIDGDGERVGYGWIAAPNQHPHHTIGLLEYVRTGHLMSAPE